MVKKDNRIVQIIIYVFAGFLIGAGAILPGISGGVLAVIFGIYVPFMALFSSPKSTIKKYWKMFLPVLAGFITGFVSGSKLISIVFGANENVATCLFIGLILGTVPSLWKEAGKEGRNRYSYLALVISFTIIMASFVYIRFGTFIKLTPNIFSFLFCGALWGLSIIVPGLTSSSILMALQIYEPMSTGIANFDIGVILPWFAGLAVTFFLFSKLVSYMFKRHYSVLFHIVLGLVFSTTLSIIPVKYESVPEFVISLAVLFVGIFIGWILSKLQVKE